MLKSFIKYLLIFLIFTLGQLSAREVELITVMRGLGQGMGGHSAIKIDDKVYSYNIIEGKALTLTRYEEFELFKLVYNVTEERDFILLKLDLPDEKINKIEEALEFSINLQSQGLLNYDFHLLNNNCVKPLRGILNAVNPDKHIKDTTFASIPYYFMKKVEKKYNILEKKIYLSKRHLLMLEDPDIKDYFVPLSDLSPKPESWRLVYTEDLKGPLFVLRPVAGLLNIISGAAQTIYGIPTFLFNKKNLGQGLRGLFLSVPELAFFTVTKADGRPLPDKMLLKGHDEEEIFLDYRLPDLDFMVFMDAQNNMEPVFADTQYKNLNIDLIEPLRARLEENLLDNYFHDSRLNVLELNSGHLVFNKGRTLNIDTLKKFKNKMQHGSEGKDIKIMVLESNVLGPEDYNVMNSNISYIDFSEAQTKPTKNSSHALDCALLVKKYAKGAEILIANYNTLAEMESAVDYAIKNHIDIILHSELHTISGPVSGIYAEKNPVNKIAKKAYEGNILWINSAGNFREKFSVVSFKDTEKVEKLKFSGKKGELIRFDFNWGDFPESGTPDDIYKFTLKNKKGDVLLEVQDRTLIYILPSKGEYEISVQPENLTNRYKVHAVYIFSNVIMTPNSPNNSSLAAPAASPHVITIGASHKGKPLSYSSEDDIMDSLAKPEFYAPDSYTHPRIKHANFTETSAAAAYAAAYFAVLLGE